ncbi:hypothetical protein TNCT_326951 [Trichonephila clavata]|uniref:Uncharacterized protein n=1 Tax=Trichonephila clavata TaxID=2740835 RepID=A0A8X6L4C1_TRICU|nr:hypothetical protein TNCT_326951 [Trichonephila clavata]
MSYSSIQIQPIIIGKTPRRPHSFLTQSQDGSSIDHHESQRPRPSAGLSHVTKWRDAWTACFYRGGRIFSHKFEKFSSCVLASGSPFSTGFLETLFTLEAIRSLFYYCNEPNGPKEIFTCTWIPLSGRTMNDLFTFFSICTTLTRFGGTTVIM